MTDLEELFKELLVHHRDIDLAEQEFRHMLSEDDELKSEYLEWCETIGCKEKNGFREYCEEYLDSRDSIWDSLNDYDE